MAGRGGRGRGRGGGARGAARAAPQSLVGRGGRGGAARGGGAPGALTPTPSGTAGGPQISAHVQTVGVKRPGFGSSGRAVKVYTNHYEVQVPNDTICHYDGTSLLLLFLGGDTKRALLLVQLVSTLH